MFAAFLLFFSGVALALKLFGFIGPLRLKQVLFVDQGVIVGVG